MHIQPCLGCKNITQEHCAWQSGAEGENSRYKLARGAFNLYMLQMSLQG